jgi:hypothetical protein
MLIKLVMQIYLYLFLSIFIFYSCAPKALPVKTSIEKITMTTALNLSKKNVVYYMPLQMPHAAEVSLDMDISSKRFSQDVTTKIRFIHKDTTWISITGMIEGARVMIVGDTFQMLDRLSKKYYKEHVVLAQKILPLPLSIDFIQTMAMGVYPQIIDTAYIMEKNADTFLFKKDEKELIEKIKCRGGQCIAHSQYFKAKSLDWNVVYSDFNTIETLKSTIPNIRNYTINVNDDQIIIKSKLNEIKTDKVIEFPFVVSDKYERIRL